MKKIVLLIIVVAAAIGIIFASNYDFKSVRDTFGADITYRDDARTRPIGTNITYSLSHEKVDRYEVVTDSTGLLPMLYSATIESGAPIIKISNHGKVERQIEIKESDSFILDLKPQTSYTIDIVIKNGKGNIELKWMELVEIVE